MRRKYGVTINRMEAGGEFVLFFRSLRALAHAGASGAEERFLVRNTPSNGPGSR